MVISPPPYPYFFWIFCSFIIFHHQHNSVLYKKGGRKVLKTVHRYNGRCNFVSVFWVLPSFSFKIKGRMYGKRDTVLGPLPHQTVARLNTNLRPRTMNVRNLSCERTRTKSETFHPYYYGRNIPSLIIHFT